MKEARNYIFELFEHYHLQTGHYIDKKWINIGFANAPVFVQKFFWDALEQMNQEGFFEYKEGHGDTLFLTEVGEQALIQYIRERNEHMNQNNNNGNININFAPTMTQSQTQTQTLSTKTILEKYLSEGDFKMVQDIMSSNLAKEEKEHKLLDIVGKFGIGILTNIVVKMITNGIMWG